MTSASLKEKPVRDLARLAKQHGVAGWHAMRKDQLIKALVNKAKMALASETRRSPARPGGALAVRVKLAAVPAVTAAAVARSAEVTRRITEARERIAKAKNLATPPEGGRSKRPARDRMVLMVRGPHWLHAFWEVGPRSIDRAQSALGQEWHGARPVLRVLRIESGLQGSPSEQVVREIRVHGGVKNWFIDIQESLRCRVELGYLTSTGRFHSLVRSNAVSTPAASQCDTLDSHWGEIVDDCDRIYAMSGGFSVENNSTELQELFEERLRRPMGPPAVTRSLPTAEKGIEDSAVGFQLEVDAELIVYGATRPDAYVTLQGEPVKVQPDGTFRVRVDMPNKRQVLPIVASVPNGGGRQTVVMAIERNTKSMEPHGRDMRDD
ncbi:MAG: DUF4912 domain-containing protein [Planctomycetota bacterium]